ncbi:Bud site selection protein bud4 [Linderina pennispora]|nr:Bud site selection protein bud4 [Linderina pennispora]
MQGYYPDPRAPSDEYIAIEDLDKIDDDEIADIEMRRQGIFDEMMPATGSGHKPFNLSTVFEEDEERSSLRTSRASLRGSREWQPGTIAGTHTPSPMGLGTSNGSSLASSAGKASTESPRQSLLSTASDPVQTKRPEMQQRPRPLSQPQSVVRRMSAISEAYDKDIDEEEEEAEDNEPLQTLASPARSAKVSPHGSSASTGNPESPVKVSPRDSAASMGVRSNFVVPGAEDDKGSVRSMANSSGSFPFDAQAVYGPSLEDTSTMASRSSMGRPEIGVMSRPVSASASLMMLQPMDSGDLAQSSGVRSRHSPTPYDSNAQLLEQAAQRANQPLAGHVTVPDHSIIGHSIGMTTDTEEGGHQDDYVGNTSVSTAPIELVFPKASTPPAPTVELGHGFASVESLPEGTHPLQLVPNDVLFRVPLSDHARTALNELNDPRLVAQWEQQQLALLRQQHSRSTHDRQEEMKRVSQFKRGPSNSLESEQGGLVYDHELALTDAPTQGITSRGTIRQLHKRPRNSDAYYPVFDLIPTSRNRPAPDAEEQLHPDDVSLGGSVRSSEASVSSHERQVGVVDEAFYSPTSQAFPEQTIAANVGEATDEVAEDSSSEVMIGPSGQPIRRNLVLRLRSKSLVDSVMDELATKERHISAPLPALETPHFDDPVVKYEGAGTDHYGTVRPTVIPSFVSQLDGVPAGPFFKPPRASERQGYLYMRILSIEDLEDKTDSVYFVIRNGIDTLATTPIKVGGAASANINQEFRILTDPNVSVTMWMRFRSDAIISNPRNTPMGARARARDPSCLPPMFKKLVRRNTRSRNNNRRWNCARPDDSDFDFSNPSFQYMPGARRPGYAANIQAGQQQPRRSQATVPDRVSSAFLSGQGGNGHYSTKSSTNGNYASDPRSLNATQAPSSVFYDPGEAELDQWSSNKGLVQAKFKEETRGVAVVHVGEMLEEVFLNSLVDSWDVENVWESRKGARLQLQLFFIPACPLFNEDELPRTLGQCENAMEVCNFHNSTLNSGFLSQRGGDTRFWRRRYFRLIGGFLFAYHEDTREPRCFIDINEATRVIDHKEERSRRLSRPTKGVARGFNLPRGSTHRRSNSDFLARGNTSRPFMPASVHEYASDSEPGDSVDIADPALRQSSMRRLRNRDRGASDVSRATFDSGLSKPSSMDSGVVSGDSVDAESGIQHSFSIEFGNQGSIEFYAESEREKLAWVSVLSRMVGCIPKIPSWLIKLLHSDIAEKVEHGTVSSDSSMESMAYGYQPFQPVPGPTMRHSAAY